MTTRRRSVLVVEDRYPERGGEAGGQAEQLVDGDRRAA
jgi:hypothetical protein